MDKYSAYRLFRNIWWFFRYDLGYGLQNLLKWFPLIWRDRDWDHCYVLAILEKKFQQMSDLQEQHGSGVHSKRHARQLKIASHLCRRMQNEPYFENAKFFGYPGKAWAKEVSAVGKQDKEMLGRLIGKYIDHWWD